MSPAAQRHIVLLRGINLGRRRVAMPKLREALAGAGFDDVATYVQSGNILLTSPLSAARVASETSRVIDEAFGLDVIVAVRSPAQLAKVVAADPIEGAAGDPKHYQVSFLADDRPDAERLARARALATEKERLVVRGSEIYTWHPDGIARSKLALFLGSPQLGAVATSRNWTTVNKLLEMAGG